MTTIETVLEPFRRLTLTQLSDEDLASVLLTYPACCVANADGHFDDDERLFMLEVCESLVEGYNLELSTSRLAAAERYACLMQIMAHRSDVDAQILSALKAEIQRDPETGQLIREMLDGAAMVSRGINEDEGREIGRILAALGL